MTDTELTYHIAFASLRGINRHMATELLNRIGSERLFFETSQKQLSAIMGFNNKLFDPEYRTSVLEQAIKETEFVTGHSIRALYYTDSGYPALLTECDDAPLMLYTLGPADMNNGISISIVGTRHATPYGLDFTDKLIEGLAQKVNSPITIVSGLAYGIDVAAHKAALRNGLPTIGVLAHGLNTIYPAAHRSIAADIVRNGGALISDYRSCDTVHRSNFIARNRIVAGMCHCLIVVESASKGGAMITARIASGYNRDVFALPGRNTDLYSQGCNRLITLCVAALIQNADELIDAMQWPVKKSDKTSQQTLFTDMSPDEEVVAHYLHARGEAQLNRMSVDLNISIGRLMAALIELEFKGLAIAYPGGCYRPAKP